MSHKTIGAILLDSGKLSLREAEEVFQLQDAEGIRFGDAAVKLGFINENDVKFAISEQFDFSYLSPDDDSIDQCLISAFVTDGPQVEALKTLRSQVSLRWFGENDGLVVCSPVAGCGSSYVSANLSVLYAQAGKKTLLVDANFRKPSQHKCFRHNNKFGLSQILANRLELDVIEPVTGLKNLHVLYAGATPPNPMELFERQNFEKIHNALREEFDVIIYDAPPVNEYAETQLIVSVVKGALFVAKTKMTKVRDLKMAKTKLENTGSMVIGVAMNDFKRKK